MLAANVEKKVGGQTLYFRTYPTHGLASQVVGYSTQSRSRAGLEESENSYLTGANADLGTILDTVGDRLKGTTIKGNNVVLTIHAGAQWLAAEAARGDVRRGRRCSNPKTGAVDVMASSPGFDPNLIEQPAGYAKIQATKSPCPPEPASPLLNRATQGLYPPGSTFKTITAAAALDDGVYTPTSTFYDPGYCTEYGKQVTTRSTRAAPRPSATSTSSRPTSTRSTPSSATSARSSARSAILDEAKKFGFYSVPPLETPSDARSASGLYANGEALRPEDAGRYSQVDPGRLAFGQDNDARDAAPDGARRRRGREQRRRDDADADQEDRLARAGRSIKQLQPHVLARSRRSPRPRQS